MLCERIKSSNQNGDSKFIYLEIKHDNYALPILALVSQLKKKTYNNSNKW